LHALADNWWLLLLRGVAAIVFGVLAFMWPVLTLLTLTFLWGAYAVVDGALALWEAIAGRGGYTGSRFWLAIVHCHLGNRHRVVRDLGRDPAAQGN
jgi:uncharacterized membrane protein HdeD (DUF308 family)